MYAEIMLSPTQKYIKTKKLRQENNY